MGVHSGKFAVVNGVPTMRQWTIEERATQPRAVASNTRLGPARKRGVHSWSGTYQAYGVKPTAMPGDTLHFVGYGAPANDTHGGTGLRYEGDCVVSQVALDWNWKSGEIIGHNTTFAGHLELTKNATGADPDDVVVPVLDETTGTKAQYSAGSLNSFVDIPNLVSAKLTLTAGIEAYVNSSTYVNGKAWTGHKSGPIDWTLALQQEDEERVTGIFDIDDIVEVKLFVDATTFWKLTYAIVRDFTGITVNRETGTIISRTINIDMNGYYGSTVGKVLFPDGSQWWPFW